jgi:hypothetical protein
MVKMLFKHFIVEVKYFGNEDWYKERFSNIDSAREFYESVKKDFPNIPIRLDEAWIVESNKGWLNETYKVIEENKPERRK